MSRKYVVINSLMAWTARPFLSQLGTTPSGLCDLETSASPWFLNPQRPLCYVPNNITYA